MAQDWPQWRGAKRDGTFAEKGLVEKFAGPEIKVKWRVPVANGYCGPTVAAGKVYVADRVTEPKHEERVHCFDSATGKPHSFGGVMLQKWNVGSGLVFGTNQVGLIEVSQQ